MTKDQYAEYLQTLWWRQIARAMRDAYPVCQKCDFPYELNVHHRTYDRLGNEKIPDDLMVLCRSCHSREHFLQEIEKYPHLVADKVEEVKDNILLQTKIARLKNSCRNAEVKEKQEDD
jgi:5-methylcytosine-specific restriction endonuclease McrA